MQNNGNKKWIGEKRGKRLVSVLRNLGWTAYFAETAEEARGLLFETCLPAGVSVGLGGSVTLEALDVLETLRSGDYRLYDRYNCDDHFEVCRDSLMADYFITGTNAVTAKGELVNLDCSGSRVAAMAYGPRHVIVVAGVNKITNTLEQAIERVKSIAPMNCVRNHHQTPCVETGECQDCNTPKRMCNHLLITMNAQKFAGKYTIIVVNEDLGF
jgi:L-lactate utilization protein LutB